MRNRLAGLMMTTALTATGMVLAVRPAAAQAPAGGQAQADSGKPFSPPRLADGHPDMQGLWLKTDRGFDALHVGSLDGTNFAAPGGGGVGGRGAGGAGRGGGRGAGGGAGRGAAGAGPPPGFGGAAGGDFIRPGVPKMPYLPAAAAEQKNRADNHPFDDPEAHCHLPGVPRDVEQPPYPIQIIQDGKYFALLFEYVHEPRVIPTDGSPHLKNFRAWEGDSRGHWEGDTLVVDVSNFNGETWLDMGGNFVDENEHVVERFTMADSNTIAYEATVDDPTVFSKPWTMHLTLKRVPDEEQILEYSCVEGERDTEHYTESVGGHKKDEGTK